MKISWGVGITITIIVFMLISFWLIYFSFSQDVNLVRDDYYQAEVQYDDKMETIKRTDLLSDKLEIKVKSDIIEFIFPKLNSQAKISGNILLYRASSGDKDITVPISLDSANTQIINTMNLVRGLWKTQVQWQIDSIKYFNEKTLMVQ